MIILFWCQKTIKKGRKRRHFWPQKTVKKRPQKWSFLCFLWLYIKYKKILYKDCNFVTRITKDLKKSLMSKMVKNLEKRGLAVKSKGILSIFYTTCFGVVFVLFFVCVIKLYKNYTNIKFFIKLLLFLWKNHEKTWFSSFELRTQVHVSLPQSPIFVLFRVFSTFYVPRCFFFINKV